MLILALSLQTKVFGAMGLALVVGIAALVLRDLGKGGGWSKLADELGFEVCDYDDLLLEQIGSWNRAEDLIQQAYGPQADLKPQHLLQAGEDSEVDFLGVVKFFDGMGACQVQLCIINRGGHEHAPLFAVQGGKTEGDLPGEVSARMAGRGQGFLVGAKGETIVVCSPSNQFLKPADARILLDDARAVRDSLS